MQVTFEKVTPGVALSPADANQLRGEIASYAEGTNVVLNTDVTFNDFKDSNKERRIVQFRIIREQDGMLYVDLRRFDRVGN
jgi:hypothetical protein